MTAKHIAGQKRITCLKKYLPLVITGRGKKFGFLSRKFWFFINFSIFTKKAFLNLYYFAEIIPPQRVGNENARFTTKIRKKFIFYVLHKKCPLNLLPTKTPFCTKYFETSSKCVKFLLLFKHPLTIRRKRGHNLQVFFKEFFLFFFHFDLPLHWLQKNRVFYKGVF